MKLKHLFITLLVAGCAAIIKKWGRPFVVKNNIEDVGFTDYSPSFLYSFGLLIFITAFGTSPRYNRILMLSGLSGAILYEVLQIFFFPERTFDWGDLLATLLGGALAYLLVVRWQKADENHLTH